jgi:probable HAF family extracellular repeat protein
MLALAGLASARVLAVPVTEFYAYPIDPELGPALVNSIASNDLMTGEDSTNHGFVMRLRKPAQPIPLPPGFMNVLGYSINAMGQITGVGETTVNGHLRVHAFWADWKKGEAFDVPPIAGRESQGFAINASGQMAGVTEGGAHFFNHAFIADAKGRHLRDLGSLSGPSGFSNAAAINSRAEVAGSSTNVDGQIHAFLSGPDGGTLVDLGTPPDGVQSNAYGMNDLGVVVGTWNKADGFLHGFITGPDGASMSDLGQFDGRPTAPLAVNADGNVVGRADVAGGKVDAFVTGDQGAGFTDLNAITHNLPTRLITAVAINDLGHIVAWGKDGFSYVLCPTPHCR